MCNALKRYFLYSVCCGDVCVNVSVPSVLESYCTLIHGIFLLNIFLYFFIFFTRHRFIVGNAARSLSLLSREERMRLTCECYARIFENKEALNVRAHPSYKWYHAHCWMLVRNMIFLQLFNCCTMSILSLKPDAHCHDFGQLEPTRRRKPVVNLSGVPVLEDSSRFKMLIGSCTRRLQLA